jgi:hypothetical protein
MTVTGSCVTNGTSPGSSLGWRRGRLGIYAWQGGDYAEGVGPSSESDGG